MTNKTNSQRISYAHAVQVIAESIRRDLIGADEIMDRIVFVAMLFDRPLAEVNRDAREQGAEAKERR